MNRSSSKRGRGGASKRRRQRKLAGEARAIGRRLKSAVAPNIAGPVLGPGEHRL